MWLLIITIILIGLVLIVTEVIFVPGTTIVGLLGFIFAMVGVIISYRYFGSEIGFYVLLGTSVLSLVALVIGFRTNVWSKFSLKSSIKSKVNEGLTDAIIVGDKGTAVTTLRPFGKAEFANGIFEVKTLGQYLERDTPIRVKEVQSNQIIVEQIY